MCYANDDPSQVWVEHYRKARKEHRCECGDKINKGEHYRHFDSLYDGRWDHFNACEKCWYWMSLLYAEEIAEGCAPWESWAWYEWQTGELENEISMRGWWHPDMHDVWEDWSGDEKKPRVVRELPSDV